MLELETLQLLLSWEWVGEAWDHHISTNPHNQLMACSVKVGVTKSRALNMKQVKWIPASPKTDSKCKPNNSEIQQPIRQVIQTVHEDLDLFFLRSRSDHSVSIHCSMLKDQLKQKKSLFYFLASVQTGTQSFSHKHVWGSKYFTFFANERQSFEQLFFSKTFLVRHASCHITVRLAHQSGKKQTLTM